MKAIYSALFFVFFTSLTQAQDAFITKWQTSLDPIGNPYVTIPTYPSKTYDYDVDWGDGSNSTNQSGDATHVYASSGIKTVTITGTFPRIYLDNGSEAAKITSIDQWGTGTWTSMEAAFHGAVNLVMTATDSPDLSQVTSMREMFRGAKVFNGDISGWDTSKVITMREMFRGASDFDQDISGWNTSMVTTMSLMFRGASDFDQNIGSWDVTSLTDAYNMFFSVTLSSENYDALLAGWAAQSLQTGVNFRGGNSQYCATDEHHNTLTQTYGWNIQDGGPCATLNVTDAASLKPTIFLQPNPAKEQFYIEGLKEKTLLRGYDPRGSLLLEREYTSGSPVDISTWPSGLYTVQLINSQGIQTKRLVK